MKNYLITLLVLTALISSCTPARQVAEGTPTTPKAKANAEVPAFKTWVDPAEESTNETVAEEVVETPKPAAKKESLEEAYARFRKQNSTAHSETKSHEEIETPTNSPSTLSPAPKSTYKTYSVAQSQPLQAQDEEKPEVIRVYIESDRPVTVDVISGSPTSRSIEKTYSKQYTKPQSQHPASEEIDPEVLKKAPYVQRKPVQKEDPQDFMMAMMENEMEEAKYALTRDGQPEQEIPITKPKKDERFIPVSIPGANDIKIDEELLRKWEKKIVDARMGIESPERLPRWLLQGLEWATHAGKAEPKRSQTIMPLYRALQDRGHLDDVNQNQMTPVQVVRKIRILVDELKASDGQLSMN